MKSAKKASKASILLNSALFLMKLIIGLVSGSLALLSDAINSFTDILSSIAILFSINFSSKGPDKEHPFGHTRSEPIAALIVAILAVVLGLDIIYEAAKRLIMKNLPLFGGLPIVALTATIVTKAGMTIYFKKVGKKTDSQAIKALMIDSKNDVFASSIALFGVAGSRLNYPILDPLAALVVALYVIRQGFCLAKENIKYLIGASPSKVLLKNIKNKALKVSGVQGVNTIKAHYIGNQIQVEIHIEVDKNKTTKESHSIGKKVQSEIEKMKVVNHAFVHIDPA